MEGEYITPEQVCEIIPGMTRNNLAQLRHKGTGPKYLKPTPRVIVYRRSDVIAWLEASERSGTAPTA
ncbi:helix-turn-helix transcriptional regulator [Microbacterium sp. MMO-10]|uniref:helix-turn-helix transcriptional regulator n=1 Tax=Microbacterium sp. MMO-10 TaxID=3081272 RepID=UPI0030180199